LNASGISVTLDYLGENVTSLQDTFDARDQIRALLDRIHQQSIDANVSVKLSQLGIRIDPALARDNVRSLLEQATQLNNRIRIDMEEHGILEGTLAIYRSLRDEHGFGHRVGIVMQAYLFRAEEDVRQLIDEGAWVRLCKGAYAEPPEIAFPLKKDTDANFVKLMRLMLGDKARQKGVRLAVATHDEAMIRATIEYANEQGIAADAFEFQMLYGIRRELQESLVARGYRVRVYAPFGTAWYPYLVRRLAEHPANLRFFISNLFRR
jgi:proline dehydrogenase